ncbi:hypothetical protein [Salipiger bermudensis]|uniref:hypothetical protein n=1 Tax=Salipiger bermudensis TaxID=344736 RepID=UPI001CD2DFBD|nr:hypothetical protein [Salipiger bermudensis]MCA0963240.1 hypothetical protein [Salipiger bermudensis]
MSGQGAHRVPIVHSVTAPFGHLDLRMHQLECGTRGWALPPRGFESAEILPVVNGTLDGRAAVAFLADLEVAAALLRGFIEDVGGAQ